MLASIGPVILALILVGVVLYLIGLIPMDATIQQIIRVLVIVAVILWLLSFFGVLPNLQPHHYR